MEDRFDDLVDLQENGVFDELLLNAHRLQYIVKIPPCAEKPETLLSLIL